MTLQRLDWRGGQSQIPELYDWSVIILTGQGKLCCNLRMPCHHFAPHSTRGVGHFDDGIILPEIPDHTPAAECAGQDVLHLPVIVVNNESLLLIGQYYLFHATHLTSSRGCVLAPGVMGLPGLLTSQM